VASSSINKFYIGILFFVVLINLLLIGHYRTENIDESWFSSFYYNYTNFGIETDNNFNGAGQNGVQFFGKTTAIIYGNVLNITDYNRHNPAYISFFIVALATIFWYKIALNIFKNKKTAFTLSILFFIFEPFVAIINSARSEALLFLILALSFYSYLKGKFWLSILFIGISFEIHPLGLLCFLPIISHWAIYKPKISKSEIFKLVSGAIIGVLFYLILHYRSLDILPSFLVENTKTTWSNLFIQYFFNSNYYRHFFDLIIFIFCFGGIVFIYKKTRRPEHKFIIIYSLLSIFLLFIYPRPNMNYTALILTGIIFMVATVLSEVKYGNVLTAFIIIILSLQYCFLIYNSRNVNYDSNIKLITSLVPEDDLVIIGSSNEWFAFKERQFYPATVLDYFPNDLKEFYLVEENDFRNPPKGVVHEKLSSLIQKCNGENINNASIDCEQFRIIKNTCP